MKFILKTLVSSIGVLIASYLLDGISIDSTLTAVFVAAVLGLLNNFIKPILIVLTIPITILTFGLFLLVINVLIVKWASDIVPGFKVSGWFSALLFSLIVSFVTSLIEGAIRDNAE
ncbi:phage holin family protein [Parasediminibacterium sp. JCM 36343]|uniref:phage holin family protein n=1 Tax=Parasediminibacterium sp. JCM 36343 TaxID=3374279 RepID=UPI00397D1DBA